ncbi:hypothetical protein N7474_002535 [Penicillium riverlandense]|uniref:uncharacterized protein n=1 Tax=Penicillium riverlandense TaxID=1903569 RepID=UPI0025485BE0|nr:uncharacterized protein N7474_002535 [Penicillium riverlandense]KAJ5825397.1 hypothetical protein N7474_002535 [Penicillium riverlandense]
MVRQMSKDADPAESGLAPPRPNSAPPRSNVGQAKSVKRPPTPADTIPRPAQPSKRARCTLSRPDRLIKSRRTRSPSRHGREQQQQPPPPRHHRLSLLETLPVEILEQIFLHSLNMNFPRASPALAAAVSSERIYRVLILLAFWDDDIEGVQTRPNPAINRLFLPLEYSPLRSAERARLQDAVFRCAWCTLDRVYAQLSTLVTLTVHRHWFGAGIVMDRDQKDDLHRLLAREYDGKHVFSASGGPRGESELSVTSLLAVVTVISLPALFPAVSLFTLPHHLIQGRRRGGFSEENTNFLEMLRLTSGFYCTPWDRGSTHTPTVPHFDHAALHHGVQIAIRQRNINAVTCLLKIDEFANRSSTRGREFYLIPADHFRAAVRISRQNLDPTFFQTLFRASAESIPADDDEITQWLVDIIERGTDKARAFAHWFFDFMLSFPTHLEVAKQALGQQQTGQLFCYGELNVETQMGKRYMEEVIEPYAGPVGETHNWIEDTFFDPVTKGYGTVSCV